MELWAIAGVPVYAYALATPPQPKPAGGDSEDDEESNAAVADWDTDDDDDAEELAEQREAISAAKQEIHDMNLRAHELLCSLYDKGRTNFSKLESPECIIDDEEKFQVVLKVGPFQLEEITVRDIERTLTVSGKHTERHDEHGLVEREFVRKYNLPKNVSWDDIAVRIGPEGVLTIDAPKHIPATSVDFERSFPIITV